MEHVYDRNDDDSRNIEQNVFATLGSVMPGSAPLIRFSTHSVTYDR